jgi:hypothetical protein
VTPGRPGVRKIAEQFGLIRARCSGSAALRGNRDRRPVIQPTIGRPRLKLSSIAAFAFQASADKCGRRLTTESPAGSNHDGGAPWPLRYSYSGPPKQRHK